MKKIIKTRLKLCNIIHFLQNLFLILKKCICIVCASDYTIICYYPIFCYLNFYSLLFLHFKQNFSIYRCYNFYYFEIWITLYFVWRKTLFFPYFIKIFLKQRSLPVHIRKITSSWRWKYNQNFSLKSKIKKLYKIKIIYLLALIIIF